MIVTKAVDETKVTDYVKEVPSSHIYLNALVAVEEELH